MNILKSLLLLLPIAVGHFVQAQTWTLFPPDECSFIRSKIQNLPVNGGEVVIPSGSYTCRSPIIIDKSDVRLKGEGNVTLRLSKRANSPVLIMGDVNTPPRPLRHIQVINLRIDGNRKHQQFECWGGPCDQGGTTAIRNNGITVRAVTKGQIQDVYVTSARSGGIVTEKGCFDLDIFNLTSVDNEFDGFAGCETVGARLQNLTLARNLAAGISLDLRFRGNFFRDVRVEQNGDVGIFMRDANANIFAGVTVSDSGSHGVFLANAGDPSTCALSNEFQDLSVSRSRGRGFQLNDLCEGNKLTGFSLFQQNRDGCLGGRDGARLEIEGQLVCQD